MGTVRIHCYGCDASVEVEDPPSTQALGLAGWVLSQGETFCSRCAVARGLEPVPAGETASQAEPEVQGVETPTVLERFSQDPRAGRQGRTMRLLRASLAVLNEDRKLVVFPTVGFFGTALIVGAFIAASLSGVHHGGNPGGPLFIAMLIASYPVMFVSLYCNVALACVLGARLGGEPMTVREGWRAAGGRIGVIAGWTLLSCSVGVVLRLLEQYLPLGGRIVAVILDVSWSLATLFVVPVLAYERIGPRATLRRSSHIFRQRWGTQIKGSVGIGLGGLLLYGPGILFVALGLAAGAGVGAALIVLGVIGLLGAVAVQATLGQIFRVFVYRSAVGMDTAGSPFAQSDLQAPFSRLRRR
jgi:Family of unknown function (DUF6159)